MLSKGLLSLKSCPIFSHVTSCAVYVISPELIFYQISKLSDAPEQIFVLFPWDGWADVAAGRDRGAVAAKAVGAGLPL